MLGKIVENETVSYICPMKAETEDDSVFVPAARGQGGLPEVGIERSCY